MFPVNANTGSSGDDPSGPPMMKSLSTALVGAVCTKQARTHARTHAHTYIQRERERERESELKRRWDKLESHNAILAPILPSLK